MQALLEITVIYERYNLNAGFVQMYAVFAYLIIISIVSKNL
jgi:hypothetical protein